MIKFLGELKITIFGRSKVEEIIGLDRLKGKEEDNLIIKENNAHIVIRQIAQ